MTSATNDQQETYKRFSVTPIAAPQDMKVGISRNVRDGMHTINGLRACSRRRHHRLVYLGRRRTIR